MNAKVEPQGASHKKLAKLCSGPDPTGGIFSALITQTTNPHDVAGGGKNVGAPTK
jgi:hypothetical protein